MSGRSITTREYDLAGNTIQYSVYKVQEEEGDGPA